MMQQVRYHQTLKDKVQITAAAVAWAAGLLLAGADGPFMPYINGAGILLFTAASLWLGRTLPRLDSGHRERKAAAFARGMRSCTVQRRAGNRTGTVLGAGALSGKAGPARSGFAGKLGLA